MTLLFTLSNWIDELHIFLSSANLFWILYFKRVFSSVVLFRQFSAPHCNVGISMYLQRRFSIVLKIHRLDFSTLISTSLCSFEHRFYDYKWRFSTCFLFFLAISVFHYGLVMLTYHFTVEYLSGCNRLSLLGV